MSTSNNQNKLSRQEVFFLTEDQKKEILENINIISKQIDELNIKRKEKSSFFETHCFYRNIEYLNLKISEILSVLKKQNSQKCFEGKIRGGGKIVLVNGEFRKAFGVLLKAIKQKLMSENKALHVFCKEEFNSLSSLDKNILLADPRNVMWEHKNYHLTKEHSQLKKREVFFNKFGNYIKYYNTCSSKITIEVQSSFTKRETPLPLDIITFHFGKEESLKFSLKNRTKNWTKIELFFMDLYDNYCDNINGYKEKDGIPYIRIETAKNILLSNMMLTEKEKKMLILFISHIEINGFEPDKYNFLIRKLNDIINVKLLQREDYFALSRILEIPIFDFYQRIIAPLLFIQNDSIISDLMNNDSFFSG